jgi:D-alanyl-D-alanine carboxypeptidase
MGAWQLWTPVKLNDGRTQSYGFGWSMRKVNSRRVIEHGGAWQGFKAHIARYVDDGLTIVVFANLAQALPISIVNGVAAMLDEDLVIKPIADPDPKFTALVRELLVQFIDGKTDESRLTPEVQRSLAGAQQRISAIIKPLGPIQSFELMERNVTPEATRLRYRVKYSSMTVSLNVAVNKEGKFSGFTLQPE